MSEVILLNPPFLDPTLPPHFAAYLTGAARAAGLNCTISLLDLNIELIEQITTKRCFEQYAYDISLRIDVLERKEQLSRLDQARLKSFRKFMGLKQSDIADALLTFRTDELFYNFGRYQGAVTSLQRYLEGISGLGLPNAFSFWDSNHRLYSELNSIDEICDEKLGRAYWSPFEWALTEVLKPLLRQNPKVIGISCNYESQLIFTVQIARYLSREIPTATLCLGGTEITSIYKSIRSQEKLWELFPRSANLVVGEGESAFISLLRKTFHGDQSNHPNIVTSVEHKKISTAKIEDVNAIGSPDYSIFDFSKYLSPEPVVMYSPTRGCYWNKCTFCDYGLNFGMPTSPSRQRSVSAALQELRAISKISKVVYFAVDAISPSYLSRLASGISQHKLSLNWSAEIRLEAAITVRELATELAAAGCIGLSFGFESGSQRILDAIKKGVKVANVPELLSSLSEAGIHVQLMGFFGFPGESRQDAEETLSFLRSQVQNFTILGMGNFVQNCPFPRS